MAIAGSKQISSEDETRIAALDDDSGDPSVAVHQQNSLASAKRRCPQHTDSEQGRPLRKRSRVGARVQLDTPRGAEQAEINDRQIHGGDGPVNDQWNSIRLAAGRARLRWTSAARSQHTVIPDSSFPSREHLVSAEPDCLGLNGVESDLGSLRAATVWKSNSEVERLLVGNLSTDLSRAIDAVQAAEEKLLDGWYEEPQAAMNSLQKRYARQLLLKAVRNLREARSGDTFRLRSLQCPFERTRLVAPHHRLRDGRLAWQVVGSISTGEQYSKAARGSSSPLAVPLSLSSDAARKHPRPYNELIDPRMRKRLRRMLKCDLEDDGGSKVQRVGTIGRQRLLTGLWPIDGPDGHLRRGALA